MRTPGLLPFFMIAVIRGLVAQGCPSDTARYDLLLTGGRVADPSSGRQGRYDVAVSGGVVTRIARRIDPSTARQAVSVRGLLVVPGLIDIHTHVFAGSAPGRFADGLSSVNPDQYCPMNGITTVADAGTAGWRNFEAFLKQVILPSRTRVLSFLNICGAGMAGKPAEEDTADMAVEPMLETIRRYPGHVVGVKVGHYERSGIHPLLQSRRFADATGMPLFVECHLPKIPLDVQLGHLRAGDIITHTYEKVGEREPVVGEDGMVRAIVREAKGRGVLFDLGHGGAGFWFDQAIPAFRQGFMPNTLGSDLHRNSLSASMKSLPNLMSKCLAMGMPLLEVLRSVTSSAASALQRPELGRLEEGGVADIAVLRIEKGRFRFVDAGGERITGKRRLSAELTVRNGKVVWDLQGRTARPWSE